MNEFELPVELVRFFGFQRAATLMGTFALMVVLGVPADREAVLHDARLPMSRGTRYKLLRELDAFGMYLRAAGKLSETQTVLALVGGPR